MAMVLVALHIYLFIYRQLKVNEQKINHNNSPHAWHGEAFACIFCLPFDFQLGMVGGGGGLDF